MEDKFQLACPEANLPSLAFCNTNDDPEGRWLLATTIAGYVMLWDTHTRTLISSFKLGFSLENQPTEIDCQKFDKTHAGT